MTTALDLGFVRRPSVDQALDIEGPPFTAEEPIPLLTSLATADDSGFRILHRSDPRTKLAIFESFERGFCGATIAFDVFVLWRHVGPDLWPYIRDAYEAGRIVDVSLRERSIDIAEGTTTGRAYGLADCLDRRCGIPVSKGEDTWRMRYGQLLDVPIEHWPEDAVRYAVLDPITTWALYKAQEQARARLSFDVFATEAENARAGLWLYAETLRGIWTDPDNVAKAAARFDAEIERLTAICMKASVRVGDEVLSLARYKHKIKRPSPIVRTEKAARAMLEEMAANDPSIKISRTDTNRISLSEDALIDARIPPDHPLDAWRRLGSNMTQRTGWIEPLSSPIIRTRYNPCVDSFRTASSDPRGKKKNGPWIGRNLQNFPQRGGLRECLRPRPGHLFVVSDFGSLELVALAQTQLELFGRSALADALRAGRSPHSEMGASLLGIPYEAFDKEIPEHAEKRKLAKALNFGFPGGLGAARFVGYARREPYEIVISEEEARQLKRQWLRQWPESKLFFDYVRGLESGGWYTVNVRGHVRGRLRYPEACNTHFQTLGAFVAKLAGWRLFEAGLDLSSPLLGCRQVLFVHDEFVTEAPIDQAEAAANEQTKIMKAAAAVHCPDVPIEITTDITERYEK